VPILPSSSSFLEHLSSSPPRVASPGGRDVTSDDHVTGEEEDEANATTTPTLRFRLADDSFYEWIAAGGGGGGDVSRRLTSETAVARFWERWLERNWTWLPNATSVDDYDDLLAALDADRSGTTSAAAAADLGRDDDKVSWTHSTKTAVQLLSSSLVGFTVNRCAAVPPCASVVALMHSDNVVNLRVATWNAVMTRGVICLHVCIVSNRVLQPILYSDVNAFCRL